MKVRVESGGTVDTTRIYLASEDGTEIDISECVSKAIWAIDARDALSIASITLEIAQASLVEDGEAAVVLRKALDGE